MSVLSVNDIVETLSACYFAATSQLSLNILHWKIGTITGTAPTTLDFATKLDAVHSTVYPAMFSDAVSYYGVSARILPATGPALPPDTINTSAGPGSATGLQLPGQDCGIVSWKTYFAGRSYRGRSYIPFPVVPFVDTTKGQPTAAYKTLMTAWATATINFSTLTGSLGGTANFSLGVAKRKPPTWNAVMAGYVIPQKIATQRRRGQYGRQNVLPW